MGGYRVWKQCDDCSKSIKRFRRWNYKILCFTCWQKHGNKMPLTSLYLPPNYITRDDKPDKIEEPEEPKYTFGFNDYLVAKANYKNPYKRGGSRRTHGKK